MSFMLTFNCSIRHIFNKIWNWASIFDMPLMFSLFLSLFPACPSPCCGSSTKVSKFIIHPPACLFAFLHSALATFMHSFLRCKHTQLIRVSWVNETVWGGGEVVRTVWKPLLNMPRLSMRTPHTCKQPHRDTSVTQTHT